MSACFCMDIIGCSKDLVSSVGFPQKNNVKRDSTRRSPQSLQQLAWVDSTSPDSSRARLSLQFVCWRRGSSPFGSSRLPLRLLTNGFYCHHLSIEVPANALGSSDKRPCSFLSRRAPGRGGAPSVSPSGIEMRRLARESSHPRGERKQAGWSQSRSVTALPRCRTRHEYAYCQLPFMPFIPFFRHLRGFKLVYNQ